MRGSYAALLSLQQHCALAAFRDGHGSPELIRILARVVYFSFLMDRATHEHSGDDELHRVAEAMLNHALLRGEAGQGCSLEPGEAVHLADLLAHHDAQIASSPSWVYDDAMDGFGRAAVAQRSPLAGRCSPRDDSSFFVRLVVLCGADDVQA